MEVHYIPSRPLVYLMNTVSSFCEIPTSLLLVQGPDARKFLQGQVTCDIDKLTLNAQDNNTDVQQLTHSLGAHCNHKGRIVFNFRAVPLDNETIALSIPSSMHSIAKAALSKYIIFSKASIEETNQYQYLGVFTTDVGSLAAQLGVEQLPNNTNQAYQTDTGVILAIAPDRYELWMKSDAADHIKTHLGGTQIDSKAWLFSNINQGIVDIVPETSEKYTPHAINYHIAGTAVSFDKGCYTGQEVVARMQYLGQLKRQLFLFDSADIHLHHIKTGDAVYTPEKKQAVGEIIISASHEKGLRLLASVSVEYAENNHVYLDQDCTQKLEKLEFINQ